MKHRKARSKTAELARAQAAAEIQAEGIGEGEAAFKVKRKSIYEAAVALFEKEKKRQATPAQRDTMWNEAEQTARAQIDAAKPQEEPGGRLRRSRRQTRVRVGDSWLTLSEIEVVSTGLMTVIK